MHRFLVLGVLALATAVSMFKPDAAFTSSEIDCAGNPINPNLLDHLASVSSEQVEETLKKYLLCNGEELLEHHREDHLNDVWEALRCVMQDSGCNSSGENIEVIFGGVVVEVPGGGTGRDTTTSNTTVQCICTSGGGLQGDTVAADSELPHSDSSSTQDTFGDATCRCICGGSNLNEADVSGFPQGPPEATPAMPARLPGFPGSPSQANSTALPDFCHFDYTSPADSSGEAYQDEKQLCDKFSMTIYSPDMDMVVGSIIGSTASLKTHLAKL